MGLVIGREGFPCAHEIFESNTQDRKTLASMLDLLERRVGLPEGSTIVVDRGMAFAENIAELRRRKLHYVVAAGQKERDRLLAEFETVDGFEEVVRQPSPRNPGQKKSSVRVKAQPSDNETLILCISHERVEKDRAIREKQEGRLLKDLARVQARIQNGRLRKDVKIGEAIGRLKERYPRVVRYHSLTFDAKTRQLKNEPDEEKREVAASLDGSYLLRTDRQDFSAEEGWRIYSSLTHAENAVRCMKSPLSERPIFHHLEHSVESHIFLCVWAYHLLVAIEHKKYRDWDAQQCSQEPVSSRDALPEDDLVFFLLDLIPQIDLSAFHQYYAQQLRGQPPFDVTMMVTLLVYAYSVGVCSSRRIAAACERNLAFRAIVGIDPPDFRTISDFRKIHLGAFRPLFLEVLRLAGEMGLVKLGNLSTDGTKMGVRREPCQVLIFSK